MDDAPAQGGEASPAGLPRGLSELYRVEETLGAGAMGVVYRAVHIPLDRPVAIKLPTLTSREHIARFVREGRILAKLQHPNLVRVFDAGEEEGQPYIVLEFVEGCTLSALAGGKALPAEVVTALVTQLLDGLNHAHSHGVLHRDVKSENVMVTSDGIVKLADFGLARSETDAGGTQMGTIMGTPSYMSPEQAQGKAVDARADGYSAAIVGYELLAGRLPFHADSLAELLVKQIREAPPDLAVLAPAAPPALREAVLRGMAKKADDRFATSGEFAAALRSSVKEARLEAAQARIGELVLHAGNRAKTVAGASLLGAPSAAGATLDTGELKAATRPPGRVVDRASQATGVRKPDSSGGIPSASAGSTNPPGLPDPDADPGDSGRTQLGAKASSQRLRAASSTRLQSAANVSSATRLPSSARMPSATRLPSAASVPAPSSRRWVIPAAVAVMFSVLGIAGALRGRPVTYAPSNLRIQMGLQSATVSWTDNDPYRSRVRWNAVGSAGSESSVVAEAASAGSEGPTHAVTLAPLEWGREYAFSLLLPGGRLVPGEPVRMPGAPITLQSVLGSANTLEAIFESAVPVQATLLMGALAARDDRPRTSHRLKLVGSRERLSAPTLLLQDEVGGRVSFDSKELSSLYRRQLLPGLLPRLANQLREWDSAGFLKGSIDKYLPSRISGMRVPGFDISFTQEGTVVAAGESSYGMFPPENLKAAGYAREMRQHFESRPFAGELAGLILLGRGLFDSRDRDPEANLQLVGLLDRAFDFDYYARLIGIPFHSGVELLFDRDYHAREKAVLNKADGIKHQLPPGSSWCLESGDSVPKEGRMNSCSWKPNLADPTKWKRAELSLLEGVLRAELIFRASINGKALPAFRAWGGSDQEAPGGAFKRLGMAFDSRLLRSGINEIRVDLAATPGTHSLGVRAGNGLKELRLCWE